MSLRNIAGLYLVRLRGRIGQELLALIGIAVGVALLFAALVANSSLTGSYERLTKGIVGDAQLQLAARGSGTISERLLAETQSLRGVAKAAGLFEARGELSGPGGEASVLLLGVTPDLGELGGPFASGFSYGFLADVRAVALPTPIANSLGLSLAQPVWFTLGDRRVEARLGAKLQRSDIGEAIDSPVVLAPLRYAQELATKPAQLTRILVLAKPGRQSEVKAALKRLAGERANVWPADYDVRLFKQAAQPTSQSTAMFSVIGAMVGFLFAFSAMLLTVPQRRRLIADLQTEGYRPRTILNVLLFDALVLGVTASAIGIVLGNQAARSLFDDAPNFLQYAFTIGGGRVVQARDVVIASAGGVGASCVAVLAPTIRSVFGWAERQDDDASSSRGIRIDRTVVVGAALLTVGIVVVIVAPASATLGIGGLVCLAISMLLLLPAFLRLLVALFDLLTSNISGIVPFLVSFDLRDKTTHARSLAVAATGAVAVFGSVALQGAHADLLRGLDQTSADLVSMGDVWVVAPGEANLLVTTPFARPSVRAGDGIARIAVYRGGFLDIGDRRVNVFGPVASGPMPLSRTQILAGNLDTALSRLRSGGWMVISESIARERGLRIGDRFALPSPVPTTFRIAALSTNLGWPPGAVVLNAVDYEHAWGSSDPSALLATLDPGVTPSEGKRALRAALGADTGLTVQTAADRDRYQRDSSRAALARLAQIATLVLISAVIAMASAMGGLIWQRRGFLAGVKVEGFRTSEMWKALFLEASVLIGAGCALGAAFGLLGQSLLSRALTSVTGFPVIYSMAVIRALVTCVTVTLVAVTIVAIFGQRAANVEPESGLNS